MSDVIVNNYKSRVSIDPCKVILCFYHFCNNKSRFSLGVFPVELICMQRWVCELA